MRNPLCTLLTVLLLLHPTVGAAHDWSGTTASVNKSLVQVWSPEFNDDYQSVTGTCTAFSIDRKRGYFMTAAHCVVGEVAPVAGIYASTVVFIDRKLDVAVLALPLHMSELSPATYAIPAGKEVAMYGYAYSFPAPTLIAGNVAVDEGKLVEGGRLLTLFAPDAINGMSGGPIVDTNRQVVGVVQGGTGPLGFETAMATLYRATKAFWAGGAGSQPDTTLSVWLPSHAQFAPW